MTNLFAFLGGMGIFLFGIKLTGESLKLFAGDRLRILIDKYTTNPIMGVLVGAAATVAMQTSTGTTALTISLVKSGQMKLRQAIAIIMGANVGTTFTAFLIGIRVSDYALPIIFVGSVLYNFSNKRRTGLLGQAMIGFGALFLGLTVMQGPLRPLASSETFNALMTSVSHIPILGIGIGVVLTMIVQSSSAMIGIIQTLYDVDAITFVAGTAMVMGSNVGTTITAIIASAGGNKTTKQAALSHVLFNTIGMIFFFIILFVFNGISLAENLFTQFGTAPMMQLAILHGIFSIVTVLLLLPFINQFERLVVKIIKSDEQEKHLFLSDDLLNPKIIDESPAFALRQVKQAIMVCLNIILKQVNYFKEKPRSTKIIKLNFTLSRILTKMQTFFTLLVSKTFDEKGLIRFRLFSDLTKDLQYVNSAQENIVYFASKLDDKSLVRYQDLVNNYENNVINVLDVFANRNVSTVHDIEILKQTVDELTNDHLLVELGSDYTNEQKLFHIQLVNELNHLNMLMIHILHQYITRNEIDVDEDIDIDVIEYIKKPSR